jgi:hypothetical protein
MELKPATEIVSICQALKDVGLLGLLAHDSCNTLQLCNNRVRPEPLQKVEPDTELLNLVTQYLFVPQEFSQLQNPVLRRYIDLAAQIIWHLKRGDHELLLLESEEAAA